MKILHIIGEQDYDAMAFEQTYQGKSVQSILKQLSKSPVLTVKDEEGDEHEVAYRIVDVPDIVISREFRNFIKNEVMDYDSGKHCNFYTETESIS